MPDPNNPGYYAYIGSDNSTLDPAPALHPEAKYGSRFVQISFDADNRLSSDDSGDSSRVRITDNGNKLFDNFGATTAFTYHGGGTPVPDSNILNLMVEFKAYLDDGKAPPGSIATDMQSALKNLGSSLAEIGGRQNRIDAQADAGASFKIALEERRMNIEEMDVVEGISKFTLAKSALQIAQQMFTKVQEMSLFNYMR